MQQTLRMIFRNTEDRLTTISIPDPDTEITALDVETVMGSVVSTNAFSTTGGDIVSKVRAEIVSRDVDVIGEF